MTVTVNSSLHVTLVAGSGVTLHVLTIAAVTTDNVFNVSDPTETLTEMLVNFQPTIGTGDLTASDSDINLLTGAQAGSGSFSGNAITSTQLSYLHGVSSSIQSQLNTKMAAGGAITIGQITGSTISVTELNYLSGVTSAIQSQINGLSTANLPLGGGTMTGPLIAAAGTAGAPSVGFAGSTTTGLYLAAPNTLGVSVSGTEIGQINATTVVWGVGTTGASLLTFSGMGVSAPNYGFVGDAGLGVYRIGAKSLGLAANSTNYISVDGTANQITIGGAAATNTAIVFEGKIQGVRQIASVSVDFTSALDTTLYTVPTGRTLVVTAVYIVTTAITMGPGAVPAVSLGWGASHNELIDGTVHATLFNAITTTGQILPFDAVSFSTLAGSSGALYTSAAAASVVKLHPNTAATATTYAGKVIVHGFEF